MFGLPETMLRSAKIQKGRRAAERRRFRRTGSGYAAIQSTRPQTVGYGLTDSPAGQLAWIAEKFGEWTDGGLAAVNRDQMLTNITVYWLTGTAGSSARLYYEAARSGSWGAPRPSRPRPPGWRSSRRRSRRRSGVSPSSPTTSCTGPSSTAAVTSRLSEEPDLLIGDVREFFRAFR